MLMNEEYPRIRWERTFLNEHTAHISLSPDEGFVLQFDMDFYTLSQADSIIRREIERRMNTEQENMRMPDTTEHPIQRLFTRTQEALAEREARETLERELFGIGAQPNIDWGIGTTADIPHRTPRPVQEEANDMKLIRAILTLMYKKLMLTTREYDAMINTLKPGNSLEELIYVINASSEGEL